MKTNMGTTDRITRVVIAIISITLYVTGIVNETFGIVLIILSGVFLLTGLIGTCPLYLPFGLNTLRKKIQG